MTEIDYEKWFEAEPVELTEAGRSRKVAMLRELQVAVVARRRRRTAVRWSAAALAAALLVAVVWPVEPELPPPGSREVALQHCVYGVVEDDPSALARYAAPPAEVPADTWVDDAQLVALLAAADRPTGLIRTPDKVVLTRDVTDPLGE